jgi:DNA-binding MarR family transcriptional regulator
MTNPIRTRTWQELAEPAMLAETVQALEAHGFSVTVADSADEARQKVLELVPEGVEVFTATSATLEKTGIAAEINESGRYNSVRKKLSGLNRQTQMAEMRRLAATPEYVLGSVHAITQQGYVMAASFGGSQLPAYVHGAAKVIWVVGTQKIVQDIDEGFRRIEEYSLPLESERLQKVLGRPSDIGKILIVRREVVAGRITIVLVKDNLGF